MLSRALVAAAVVTVAVVLLVALAWAFQRRLIYLPHGRPGSPARAGLPGADEVLLRTDDGLGLGGWFVPADGRSGGAVVVFNGNAGNRSHRAPLATALAAEGLSVLLFDYRGYGGNPGSPSEEGLARDARAARDYLVARRDVDPGRLVYYGESLGAAVAVSLAVDSPPAALVLRSPFTSLADIARVHYPFLPARRLLWDRYAVADRIADVHVPTLVIAGARDGIVPPGQSRRVCEAAAGPRRFVLLGADHNDPLLLAGDRVVAETISFLRGPPARVLPREARW
ncbi:MAG: alpha/beta hydrolase [Actinobacteria bacterium]|nr:alpha/beta hydrolase [Actinomycetota bacterium]